MGNKITTIISTTITLTIFILMVAFLSYDYQNDVSKKVVKTAVENVQYRGYITLEQYNDLMSRIPYKNVRLSIARVKNDEYNKYIVGTSDIILTQTIVQTLVSSGIYKFEIGDLIQMDLISVDSTLFDSVVSTVLGEGTPMFKMITSESGVILNKKY